MPQLDQPTNKNNYICIKNCNLVLASLVACIHKKMTIFVQFCFIFFQLITGSFSSESAVSQLLFPQTQCCKPLPAVPEFQSCAAIKEYWPDSPSAYYHLSWGFVYCHMDELCGTKGGWTRVAYLNMSDSNSSCPSEFKFYQSGEVRACGRATSSGASCTSVKFSTTNGSTNYSQVCGRVVGYQYGSPDAVYPGDYSNVKYGSVITPQHNDINSYYVNGVSITHGYPRQHIWTLMAGISESSSISRTKYNCPCAQYSKQNSTIQSFIGNDYFCESGNPNSDWEQKLYVEDPLWDGKGCGTNEATCCSATGLPWFNKVLNSTTTDYVELRVCADESTANEDVPVSFYEIYIK